MLRRSNFDANTSTGMGAAAPTSVPRLGLMIGTALASVALAGCTASAPPAETSFTKAQAALANGKVDRAVIHAEQAVLAAPRSASYRALLGAAYLEAGRFEAAATSFDDALVLGDTNPRTVLSYALSHIALGDNVAAMQKLDEYESTIPVVDYGLAVALAGQPERGTHILVNAVRAGSSHAKARQNLAYAYALAGNWPAARVMAAEDVPASQVDERIVRWAETIAPEAHRARVASLLGVTTDSFGDLPGNLALSNFPSQDMMVAEAQEMRADELNADLAVENRGLSEAEVLAFNLDDVGAQDDRASVQTIESDITSQAPAPVAMPAPAASPTAEESAARAVPGKDSPVSQQGRRFVANAVVQDVAQGAPLAKPVRAVAKQGQATSASSAPKPGSNSQARAAIATGSAATHLVQLGSYDSRDVANDKWVQFTKRFPQLAGRDAVVTEAVVNGRTYFRLAAAGFGRRTAKSVCDTVKASGRGCFTYAASSPPAGAVKSNVRIAARSS